MYYKNPIFLFSTEKKQKNHSKLTNFRIRWQILSFYFTKIKLFGKKSFQFTKLNSINWIRLCFRKDFRLNWESRRNYTDKYVLDNWFISWMICIFPDIGTAVKKRFSVKKWRKVRLYPSLIEFELIWAKELWNSVKFFKRNSNL